MSAFDTMTDEQIKGKQEDINRLIDFLLTQYFIAFIIFSLDGSS